MGGNLRGNGHYNASRRNKERDEMGYEPKTIKIGDKWVSYKGIIGLEHMLSIVGDLAYYAGDIDEHVLENFQAKLAWTIGATFLNETPLSGVEPVFDALNGNVRAFNRLVSQSISSWIPASGALGVLSKAIDGAQKDIGGEITGFVQNRLPGLKNRLPDQIDIWTGEPLNDIDNPFLRALNAISPIQISGTDEPWRQWLRDIGYNGLSMLTMDSTGSYRWEPADREQINKYIGEQQLYKQVQRLMKSKRYAKEIQSLKKLRRSQYVRDKQKLDIKTTLLPVHQELNTIIRNAQKIAEAKYLTQNPHIEQSIINAQTAEEQMRLGDVEAAGQTQLKDQQTRELINYGN